MKKLILSILAFVIATLCVNAQSSKIHIGASFPSEDFNDDDDSNPRSGYAAIGFNVGYKFYNPILVPNLSLAFGIDLFYNDIKKDQKEVQEDYYSNYNVTFPKYINVPATFGLNYTYPVKETFGIYGEFGVGLNFSFETMERYERKNSDYDEKITYTPALKPCLGFEGGILLNNKFTIGLRYNNFGAYKYKYKQTLESSGGKETNKGRMSKQPIANLTITAGIRF